MRAEIVAYMISLEGPEYPKYVMHIVYTKYSGTTRYRNMLGNSLPVGPAQQTEENYLKSSGCSQERNTLHKAFPRILQVIISNGMAQGVPLGAFLNLVALYRAMRLQFGYGFESCDAPRNVQKNTNLAKHRPVSLPPTFPWW